MLSAMEFERDFIEAHLLDALLFIALPRLMGVERDLIFLQFLVTFRNLLGQFGHLRVDLRDAGADVIALLLHGGSIAGIREADFRITGGDFLLAPVLIFERAQLLDEAEPERFEVRQFPALFVELPFAHPDQVSQSLHSSVLPFRRPRLPAAAEECLITSGNSRK